ncbi:putative bacteriophage protein [Methylorubrum populi]|uniref:Putative bacteriophage protein n=1 Tax=Methylorubrum populi TaxID=223967 RepID=A0A160PLY9_9HYPH|nr:DUF1073 domain-containing protein [Methylorubrum populi]BAU93401.1 putative bacteriophage protein [Methylorubrum populi]
MTEEITKPRVRVPAGVRRTTDARTTDSFQNFEAALGLGADNQMSSSRYGITPLTRNRAELEAMYRSSWIVRQAVSVPADDMTRAGIEFYGLGENSESQERNPLVLQNALDRLDVWGKLASTIRWARLYGGALAVILIEGQDLTTPLDPATITKGQFKGLLPIDRWALTPSTETVTELGPDFGRPVGYAVIAGQSSGAAVGGRWIHHTRVVRLEGNDLPYYQRQAEMGWGMSVVETFHDRLVAFDSTTLGMAQMVYKAHLRILKMKDLRKNIATGGKPFAAALTQVELIRRFQTNEGLTLLDSEDDFSALSYNFSGLSDVMVQMAQQIAGAIDMPIVKLFGMSPAGFSTGESDLRSYNDNIHLSQERDLRRPLEVIAHITFRSEYGEAPPSTFGFRFASLYGLNDKEKAEIAVQVATALSTAEGTAALKPSIILRELKRSSETTGIFASVSDDDIARAEADEADTAAPPPESDEGDGAKPVSEPGEVNADPKRILSLVPRIPAAA